MQFFFTQIFGYCNGEHSRLFPNIRGNSCNITPEFTDFEDFEKNIQEDPLPREFLRHASPNTLFKPWRKVRAKHGDEFFEHLLCRTSNIMITTYFMPTLFSIATDCSVENEIIKKDLKIRDGLLEPGSGALSRAAFLFTVSVLSKCREGVEIVFNSWEKIRGENSFIRYIFNGNNATFVFYLPSMPPEDFLEELYGDVATEKRLMDIYCHLGADSFQFNAAYDLLTKSSNTGVLFETLYDSLGSYIQDQLRFVLEVLNIDNYSMEDDAFSSVFNYLNTLSNFIKRVDTFRDDFVKGLNKKGESDPRFNKNFDEVKKHIEDIRYHICFCKGSVQFKKIIRELRASLTSQGRLNEMMEIVVSVCDKIDDPPEDLDLEEIKKLFKEMCDELDRQGDLDEVDKLLNETCTRLNDMIVLVRTVSKLEDILKEIKEQENKPIENA